MASPEKVQELVEAIQALSQAISNKASRVDDDAVRNRLIRMQPDILEAVAKMGAGATPWSKIPSDDIDSAIELATDAKALVSKVVDLPTARALGRAVGKLLEALAEFE